MDWKSIFCQYAEHVNSEEHDYFFIDFKPTGLTNEEMIELDETINKLDGGERQEFRNHIAEIRKLHPLKKLI